MEPIRNIEENRKQIYVYLLCTVSTAIFHGVNMYMHGVHLFKNVLTVTKIFSISASRPKQTSPKLYETANNTRKKLSKGKRSGAEREILCIFHLGLIYEATLISKKKKKKDEKEVYNFSSK